MLLVASPLNGAEPVSSWPQFRGPGGQGHAAAAPLRWSEGENVVWKTELPGRGWSSPIVVDGRVWLTSAIETEAAGAELDSLLEPLQGRPGADQMAAVSKIDLWVMEFDWATGQPLRKMKAFTVERPDPIHGFNSHSSPTPVYDDGRLFCHFGTYGTACIDVKSGETLWRTKLELEHGVGPGSSPALCDDLLIIPCDGMERQFIAALDKRTGKTVWSTPRPPIRIENGDMRKAFSTPLVVEVDGRRQVVVPGAQWFAAYDPVNGEEIWRVDHGAGFSNVPRPVFDGERLYLCTGFSHPELVAIHPDGSGDVTETHVAWRWRRQVPTIPSPVVVDGLVFF
ncbi:MAG: PQQ-binding-like beta-propeller repeat protein, partial [Planctomycetota bacterium]